LVYSEEQERGGWRFESVVEESIVCDFDGARGEHVTPDEEAVFGGR
jgi:hypothetical protein